MMQTADSADTPRRRRQFQEPRKLRAWGSTLKPNSPLRHEPPATVAVLRALVNLNGGELTFLDIAKRAGGISWRQVQRIVAWARAGRLIHTTRLGNGRGMFYVLMPALAANFLGRAPLKKRRSDMPTKSHQGRGIYNPSSKGKSAPRRSAVPNPPAPFPDSTGKGEAAGATAWVTQPGREAVRSVAPSNSAARAASSRAGAAGASQRSNASAAERAELAAKLHDLARDLENRAGPPRAGPTARDGPRRRRFPPVVHPDRMKKNE